MRETFLHSDLPQENKTRLTLIPLLSVVQSKARLLKAVGRVSCWLLKPGSGVKLALKPRTQATPTTCKILLSEAEEIQHHGSALGLHNAHTHTPPSTGATG